jgi:hypothetical protein
MRRWWAIAGLCLAAATAGAQPAAAPVEFVLKVSPTTGTVNEEFTVTVSQTIRGVNAPERYWPPELGDFTVTDQRSQQSTQWLVDPRRGQEIINVETRWYRLKPNRVGRLRIGEARVRVDGVEYKSKPVVVEVLPAGGSGAASASPDPQAAPPPSRSDVPGFTPPDEGRVKPTFLHVVADRNKVYVGEQVTVTWLLYTRSDVLKFDPKPPKLEGFWAETLFEPERFFTYRPEVVAGREFAVAVVAKRALFPTKPGTLVVPRFEADVSTLYSSLGAPLRLASEPVSVEAVPLPPGAPAGFDQAYVGKFSVEASVDRDAVAAGESLTLALVVRGAGAIRRTKVPPLTLDGFQVTPPVDYDQRLDTSSDELKGERRYSYLLTPTRGGKLTIPRIELPYFEPGAARYEVATTEPIPIMVIGDPSVLTGKVGAGATGENLIGRDIRPAREVPSVGSRMVARFYHSRAFLVALAAPGALFVLVVLGDKLRERLRRETPRARLRRARGRARKRLRVAEVHIRGGRAGKFFGEVARVLTEHLEERVGEPVSAMTREQLRDYLTGRGFPEETVDALVRELENCDFARFAPSASGPGEMRAALRRVRALLSAIERVRPTPLRGEAAA